MRRHTHGRSSLCLAVLAVVAGCHGGGGGKNRTGNPAIDALLPQLYASIRSGDATIDPSLTTTTIDNPFDIPASETNAGVAIGSEPDDGTVAAVDVGLAVTKRPDGSFTLRLTVDDAASAHRFMEAELRYSGPSLSVRVPPYGFSQLSPTTGTGTAYVILQTEQHMSGEGSFANTNAGGETLVNLANLSAQPPSFARFSQRRGGDFMATFEIDSIAGALVARLARLEPWNAHESFERSGGPPVTDLQLSLGQLEIASSPVSLAGRDPWFAVGSDWGVAPSFANGDAIVFSGSVAGGVLGHGPVEIGFGGAMLPPLQTTTTSSFTFTGTVNASADDGVAQLGALGLIGYVEEDVPTVQHSLNSTPIFDNALNLTMKEALFLRENTGRTVSIGVLH